MHPIAPLLGVIALVAVATTIGLLLRTRKGRVRELAGTARLEPATLGVERFGTAGTVVQFSTEFCSRCPGVRRLLSKQVDAVPSVEFVHLDLTHEPELAARFNVLQTPTILFIDAAGRPSARLSGQLDHNAIREAVDTFVDAAASSARLTASGTAVRTARSTSTSALTTGAIA